MHSQTPRPIGQIIEGSTFSCSLSLRFYWSAASRDLSWWFQYIPIHLFIFLSKSSFVARGKLSYSELDSTLRSLRGSKFIPYDVQFLVGNTVAVLLFSQTVKVLLVDLSEITIFLEL